MAESLTHELYFSKAEIMFRQVGGMTVRKPTGAMNKVGYFYKNCVNNEVTFSN